VIALPVELLHFSLEQVPIVWVIARKQFDNLLDFGVTVMWDAGNALLNFNAVQFTLGIEVFKVIGDVIAGENDEGSRLSWARHES